QQPRVLRRHVEVGRLDLDPLYPAISPPARADHAMAFDEARGLVVLFGGRNGQTGFWDTWEWDGGIWKLRVTPWPSIPSANYYHAMAYHSARGRVVLFGGSVWAGPTVIDDTWEWDGVTWTRRTPLTRPPHLIRHAMANDAGYGVVVLFGGATWGAYM